MTLVLSELSVFGVAMAADAAITTEFFGHLPLLSGRQTPPVVRTGARKLVAVPQAGAAISVWGFGAIGTPSDPTPQIPIDLYLLDFAAEVPAGARLADIGESLARKTNLRIRIGQDRGGFHVGGFISEGPHTVPAVYTVHTGPEDASPQLPLALYRDFPDPRNLDISTWATDLRTHFYYVRNGDFGAYALLAESLFDLTQRLAQEQHFVVPSPDRFADPLEGRGRFLRLQLQTICEFYRLSNRLETIAGPVSWITIGPEGIRHMDLTTL